MRQRRLFPSENSHETECTEGACERELALWTIGHSNQPLEAFLRLLTAHEISLVADVRKIPRSARNPQFNDDALAASLKESGIGYEHFASLGGLRKGLADSPNAGWKNASFRAFADYMLTSEFASGVDALLERAKHQRLALMCAESLPWRCHRSLIADALVVRGAAVFHILSGRRVDRHVLRPWARVEGSRLFYPAPENQNAGPS